MYGFCTNGPLAETRLFSLLPFLYQFYMTVMELSLNVNGEREHFLYN